MNQEKLCPACLDLRKTHTDHELKCTGGAKEGYNNCFDRNHGAQLSLDGKISPKLIILCWKRKG